mmetsp:Transcript_9233/g.14209  ORF Transcript_9233/g.14209 Transcript_9233/m.14209 type:complete len:124 (+) Transcript_9233:32-403(+)
MTAETAGKIIYCTTEQEYHQAIQAAGEKLVVVDVFAEWCPPCRQISPVFEALAQEYPNVFFIKVDVDKVPSIKNILSVWAMPTFAFLQNGVKVGSFMGANETQLRRGLQNNGNIGICSSCTIQ